MPESNVAISPDNTQTGFHNIRTVTVAVDNSAVVSGGQSEQQQVVMLADEDGHVLKRFIGGFLPVASPEIALLLKAMLIRLDHLCYFMDRGYSPPDNLGLS